MTNSIQSAIDSISTGGMVVVLGSGRENEACLVMAAQYADARAIAFFVTHTSGLIRAPITDARADVLDLPHMVCCNEESTMPRATVACDAAEGVTTGISAIDRATTLRALAHADAESGDIVRPGHVRPLRTHPD